MAKIIGMPELEIVFRHLGTTALRRGEKGQAILVVKEEKEGLPIITLPTYNSFDDDLQKTFSEKNVKYIKDTLKMQPKELVVVRMSLPGEAGGLDESINSLNDALRFLGTKAERNCWISVAEITKEESEELTLFVSEKNKFDKKRYKAVVYQHDADDMHVVNFTTPKVKMKDGEELIEGVELIPLMLGAIAGQSLNSSLIAKKFTDIEYVVEPEDKDIAVDKGELFLFNDDGAVRIGRAVNSLTTIEEGMTNDMRFILIVEVMDLIFTDIHFAWTENYKGKYKNILDNQMLFVSAINSYFAGLENDNILDNAYENNAAIDVNKQRLANVPLYGEEEVGGWDNNRVLEMTVGTNVYLGAQIKIPNAMEDLFLTVIM